MKIAIVPFHSGLANDILFDKDNESTNSDDLITPYYYIKQEYEKRGVSINTLDQYNTLDSLDCVLFFKLDYNELIRCIKSKVKRLYYFAWEPEVVDNHHYQNFYEFPKFRIKLLILILLHFNIVRIIY